MRSILFENILLKDPLYVLPFGEACIFNRLEKDPTNLNGFELGFLKQFMIAHATGGVQNDAYPKYIEEAFLPYDEEEYQRALALGKTNRIKQMEPIIRFLATMKEPFWRLVLKTYFGDYFKGVPRLKRYRYGPGRVENCPLGMIKTDAWRINVEEPATFEWILQNGINIRYRNIKEKLHSKYTPSTYVYGAWY